MVPMVGLRVVHRSRVVPMVEGGMDRGNVPPRYEGPNHHHTARKSPGNIVIVVMCVMPSRKQGIFA